MHDPWDVAATRRSDQYVSCMKINGVPLLPPVVSTDCRKEMQYYKVLALEVEKRLSLLNTFAGNSDSIETVSQADTEVTDYDSVENYSIASDKEKNSQKNDPEEKEVNQADIHVSNGYDSIQSDITVIDNSDKSPMLNSPKLVSDVNLAIGDIFTDKSENPTNLSERDYNFVKNKPKTPQGDEPNYFETKTPKEIYSNECIVPLKDNSISSPIKLSAIDCKTTKMGPPSLCSSKSVDDIHAELCSPQTLARQSSYTILQPSPELLAHLEVQSLTSGVEMSSISMSESCSNLLSSKKRRSWDLETAKVKWSSMASELNQGVKKNVPQKRMHIGRSNVRLVSHVSPTRAKSSVTDRYRRSSVPTSRSAYPYCPNNGMTNSKLVSKTRLALAQPLKAQSSTEKMPTNANLKTHSSQEHKIINKAISRNVTESHDDDLAEKLSMNSSKSVSPIKSSSSSTPAKEDPSACIRELYEKIQNQQLLRMSSLIEKQKKEQLLLQQVFEEQNTLFYKQLKTICPESPKQVKAGWPEKSASKGDFPVSLSQVINSPNKATNQAYSRELSATINDTHSYIHKTEEVLKKSRNVLNGIKNSATKNKPRCFEDTSPYAVSPLRPKSVPSNIRRRDDNSLYSVTKTVLHSAGKNLDSNSSQSSREAETLLTDRTNDTMADLNFTLNSDDNVEFNHEPMSSESNTTFVKEDGYHSPRSKTPHTPMRVSIRGKLSRTGSVDSNIDYSQTLEERDNVKTAVYTERRTVKKLFTDRQATKREREAASRIVAGAKGYLVRRLLRTERVQSTVQTIRDALVCALQLHQERDGIRGADVDLHRRLIQQITAACYSLNDTFITSSAQERCALIAQDRDRQSALAAKQMTGSSSYSTPRTPASASAAAPTQRRLGKRKSDIMSHSHSGVLASGSARTAPPSAAMTHSSHEMYSGEGKWSQRTSKKYLATARELNARQPWR